MTWAHEAARLVEFAPAKVNLALHVRRRRADGYHDIETAFVFADVGDTLAAERADALTLAVDGPFAAGLAADGGNLVLRAARALAAAAGVTGGAALTLTKRLPVAAGLGGGSADAAAALRLLNRLWELGWPVERLAGLGGTLGADVPACVHGRPLRGAGAGEVLTPLPFPGAAAVLANPGVAVATGPVFAGWDAVDRGPLDDWRDGRNDLAPPAVALAPAIAEALAALAALPGAELARMSGSGATCFALFADDDAAEAAAAALARARPDWWIARTRLAGS